MATYIIPDSEIIKQKYQLMLTALHLRETQVMQMFTYFIPAFAGLGWLLSNYRKLDIFLDVLSGCSLIVFLAIGRSHIATMAYNYRSVQAQCRKLEKKGNFQNITLDKWHIYDSKKEELFPEMFKAQAIILLLTMSMSAIISEYLLWILMSDALDGCNRWKYIPYGIYLGLIPVVLFVFSCVMLCEREGCLKQKIQKIYKSDQIWITEYGSIDIDCCLSEKIGGLYEHVKGRDINT